MQPFPNPNYFTQYSPYPNQTFQAPQPNPYMERLNNLQQYQQALQQQQPSYLSGKVVDSVDVVKATDIPMDGNMYYFPKADGTEIYAKSWLPNGTTRILTFKPVLEQEPGVSSNETERLNLGAFSNVTDTFMKRFDALETRFDKLEQSITPKQTSSRSKKEAETE